MSEVNERPTEVSKTAEHFCTTYLKQTSASMEWTIANFNLLQIDSNCIESSAFESATEDVHTGTWKLKLFPKYTNEEKVGLFFVCSENLESIFVKCKACIIDAEGKDANKKEFSTQLTSKDIGFSEFITRSDLVESLLPNGNLTIRCSVTVTCKNQTQFKKDDVEKFRHGSSLPQDFSKLLKEELLSDVILLCDGRQFPVHKCILSARSSVFSAMFTHDFKEKEENVVEIKDTEANILENLIHYIYSDSILYFSTVDVAIKLLGGADKYGLLELKEICEKYLKNSVSIHNLFEVAVAADLHNLNSLKEVCIDFMCEHGREVVFSDNSKDLYFSAPQYLLEGVLKQLFGGQFPHSQTSKMLPQQFENPEPPTQNAFTFKNTTVASSSIFEPKQNTVLFGNTAIAPSFGFGCSAPTNGFGCSLAPTNVFGSLAPTNQK